MTGEKAMTDTTTDFIEKLMQIDETEENEEQIRELICCVLAENRDEKIKKQCLRKLRALENEKCVCRTSCEYSYFDLSELLRSVCLCSDILLGQTGKRLCCELEPISLAACPDLIADGFLNLLSNAAKFGGDGVIEVTLRESGKQAVLSVRNRGHFDFQKAPFKRGIAAAANSAKLHSGRLFFGSCDGIVTAAMSVSLFLRPTAKRRIPLFTDLLSDEFSAVHIGLSDAEENSETEFV